MDERFAKMLDDIHKKLSETKVELSLNSHILLVDGLNTFIRTFAAIPICNEDGTHIGGMAGFLKSIGYAIEIIQPTRVIIVFDGAGGAVRKKKLYPEYKQRRNPHIRLNRTDAFATSDEEQKMMVYELIRTTRYLEQLPVTTLSLDNVEADDVIAYIISNIYPESHTTIMSSDKDFLQLISNQVEVWSPTKKKLYNHQSVLDEYKISPENMCLYRSILGRGDISDNIHGISGLGEKTIVKRFPMFLENRKIELNEILNYAHAHDDQIYKRVLENENIIERNYRLMQLKNVDISANSKSIILKKVAGHIKTFNKLKFMKLFIEDKMWAAMPNIEWWLKQHIQMINRFAQLSSNTEVISD